MRRCSKKGGVQARNIQRENCGAVSLIFKMAGTTFFLWQPVAAPGNIAGAARPATGG